MTTPSDHDDASGRSASASGESTDGSGANEKVDLGKAPEPPFDPYRFGKPDHPVPPEFAPPGYVPDPVPVSGPPPPPGTPAPGGPYPYGAPPYGQSPYPPYGQPPQGQPPQGQYPYGQSPYGQNSYGQAPYPVPPAQYGGQPQGGSNGKAITSLVLGILSIVMCWLTFIDAVLIIPAVVFGILGLAQAKSRNGIGKSMAIAGLVCATVGALLAIVFTVLVVRAYDRCGGASQSGTSDFQQCVQDNFVSGRDLDPR